MKIKRLCMVILSAVLALGILSCSSHSEGSSFTSHLDSIDAFISQGSTDSAIKALKKLEKKAYSSYERLGIYKRYILLGEKFQAEKILLKGLKKLPDNLELSAIYVNFLLREGRLEDAFEASACLEKSSYSSLYSECVLRKALVAVSQKGDVVEDAFTSFKKKSRKFLKNKSLLPDFTDSEIKEIFCSDRFIQIYAGAFKGSSDSRWLYNAASILMKTGNYRAAAELYPQKITNFSESLFWGCVFFDSGLYAQSLASLEASDRLASLDGTGDFSESLYAEILALKADCCYVEGDEERSEELRLKIAGMNGEKYLTPVICMNGAVYSRRHSDVFEECSRLDYLLKRFPGYFPGIALKAQIAMDQLHAPEEDDVTKKLRAAGIKTREMEVRDEIPKVSIDDVYDCMDSFGESSKLPQFEILKDILDGELKKAGGKNKSLSDIWKLLESNENENGYPSEIVRYCTASLIAKKMNKEAEGIFTGCLKRKYGFDLYENPQELELWEVELLSWFACKNSDFVHGASLYRFIADRYGQRLPVLNTSSENRIIINSLVNLAVVYASMDELEQALEILSMASSRTDDAKKKAEILYRMAEISWNMGDARSASRTLKYALALDESHNRSRLLQKKIRLSK